MSHHYTTIETDGQGQRLDKFLSEQKKTLNLSRSQIQKAIKNGLILVNGQKPSVHQFLKAKDQIEIIPLAEEKTSANAKRQKSPSPSVAANQTAEPKIIAEEKDYLIIEKPAGLLVHPTDKKEPDTLVDWLLSRWPGLAKIGENPERPAIVHRLDKEVSGLMIIPQTQDAFDFFKRLFKEHRLSKKYLALVYGQISQDQDEINFPISRSRTKPGLFAAQPLGNISQENQPAKTALTSFTCLQRFKNFSLLEVEIMTGRTHQIRVHLQAYGHPVVGDRLYLSKKIKTAPLERIFLHAAFLSFSDPDEVTRHYRSPLPSELKNFLSQLRPL